MSQHGFTCVPTVLDVRAVELHSVIPSTGPRLELVQRDSKHDVACVNPENTGYIIYALHLN